MHNPNIRNFPICIPIDSRMTLIIAARAMPAAINSFPCDANPLRDATNKIAVIAAKLVAMKAAFAQLSSELARRDSHPPEIVIAPSAGPLAKGANRTAPIGPGKRRLQIRLL
jgi:hypothetical protein